MVNDPASGIMVGGRPLPPDIVDSIKVASRATGVDFNFLVAQASVESGFQGDVRSHSRHSTAAGLFQFTNQTWLQMMREHGAKYGHADWAQSVVVQANGHLGADDPATEKKILDLRKDVKLSAIFAAEFAKQNAQQLQKAFGRKIGAADLHLAHLLGASGAIRFLKAHQVNSAQPAAELLPAAARQNPNLFFDRGDHTPHTVATVYRKVRNSIETPLKQAAATQLAGATPAADLRPGLGLSDATPRRRDGV